MWSRFKRRVLGGSSSKQTDDASSLDESLVHSCVRTDNDEMRKSQQLAIKFSKDDSQLGLNNKPKRKLSWFGRSRARTKPNKPTVDVSDKPQPSNGTPSDANNASSSLDADAVAVAVTATDDDGDDDGDENKKTVLVTIESDRRVDLTDELRVTDDEDDIWTKHNEYSIQPNKGTFGPPPDTAERLPSSHSSKMSPPKLKRRAKPMPSNAETGTRKSRLFRGAVPDPSSADDLTPPDMSRDHTENNNKNTVCHQSNVDTVTSPTAVKGKRVPPPVPVRRYPLSATTVQPLNIVTSIDKSSPSPTTNSPDSASYDTEGKESGYVTLDDLQAQLMRSSWSSDDRDTETTITDAQIQSTEKCNQGSACNTLTSAAVSSDDDIWPAPPSPLSDACSSDTPPSATLEEDAQTSVVRFTFTVKLDSQLLKRRRLQQLPDDEGDSRPAAAVPDVVVCSDANSKPTDKTQSSPGALVAVVDGRVEINSKTQQKATVKQTVQKAPHTDIAPIDSTGMESRSCQTDESLTQVLPVSTACLCTCPHDNPHNDVIHPVTESVTEPVVCGCSTPNDVDDDDDVWEEVRREDDGSYLRPLVTRVYANNSGSDTKHNETVTESELTHMSWGELLQEAQTMGIPLQHPLQINDKRCVSRESVDTQSRALTDDMQRSFTNSTATNIDTPKTKSSFRQIFRFPWLFSRKKSATVKRSRSMEPAHRMHIPTSTNHQQQQHLIDSSNNRKSLSRLSRYSASSCPPTSNCRLACSRTISVSSSRHATGEYFAGSWAGSSCSGSLPPYRHRSDAEAHHEDAVCVSPSSVTSFSSCSRTTPWRCVPSTPHSISNSCTSPGLSRSLSKSGWHNNPTDFVNCLSELQNCGWYWGALSFEEAEAKLANRRDGSFLVRDSSDERYILSLSFRSLNATHHTRIEHYKGCFNFCSQPPATSYTPATTIVEFIEGAMLASRSGQCLYYLKPRASGQPPAPVRLVFPVSRFRCMHSLQHLCKFAVLRHVRLDMVDRLPVPPRLKEYLKHGRATVVEL